MTTIRVERDITNIATPPRRVTKTFSSSRDHDTDPIEPGEVLRFPGDVRLPVIGVADGDGEVLVIAESISQPGLDVDAEVAKAVATGWEVLR